MNIISSGGRFRVYGEAVQTYDNLPVKTYQVNFSQMDGYSLSVRNDLQVTEEKIYGNSIEKVEKTMNSYKAVNRNFGVLLSGQKGIGKSLFLRILASKAIEEGIPVITVTESTPGIADFISSINQDCVVVFDEFEKVFAMHNENSGAQDELLSLFDGIDGGHKLFVVTCNDLSKVSQYMLDRPGRFHYHFTMSAPKADEVKEYMIDKLKPEYHDAIQDVVNLSAAIDMPYDYLRAIAFELNQGYSLKETMNDLNISKKDYDLFDIEVHLSNGLVYESFGENVDLNEKYEYVNFRVQRPTGYRETNNIPMSFNIEILPGKAKIINNEFIIGEDGFEQVNWKQINSYNPMTGTVEKGCEAFVKGNVHITKIKLKKVGNRYNTQKWFND